MSTEFEQKHYDIYIHFTKRKKKENNNQIDKEIRTKVELDFVNLDLINSVLFVVSK